MENFEAVCIMLINPYPISAQPSSLCQKVFYLCVWSTQFGSHCAKQSKEVGASVTFPGYLWMNAYVHRLAKCPTAYMFHRACYIAPTVVAAESLPRAPQGMLHSTNSSCCTELTACSIGHAAQHQQQLPHRAHKMLFKNQKFSLVAISYQKIQQNWLCVKICFGKFMNWKLY